MNKTEHLLTCLIEEASEVQKAAAKALRFGLEDGYPGGDKTNQQDLFDEIVDFNAVVELLDTIGINFSDQREYRDCINRKKKKVVEFMDYAAKTGTLVL